MEQLNISYTEQLPAKCYGLSLSDQYWICPAGEKLKWSSINFFEHTFSDDVGNILFGHAAEGDCIDLLSPCNTSDGWLKKKWKIVDGKRCLIKGGSAPYYQEPLNEVFAAKLHEKLGWDNYVPYHLVWEDENPFSICENFIDTETELVSAVNINRVLKKRNQDTSYQHFMKCVEQLGIPNMRKFLDYLLVFDFIMVNTDRHFGNFGAVRNIETLEWVGPAPVFDSGTSLWHNQLTKVIRSNEITESKPLYARQSRQMELFSGFSWIPFECLTDLKDVLYAVFMKSEYMDEERIETIGSGILNRVEQLKEMAMDNNPKISLIIN